MATSEQLAESRRLALVARQNAVLDKPVRLDGVVTTWRDLINSGRVAYARESVDREGKRTYGLITHAQLQEESHRGIQNALAFSAYWETPKLVADYFSNMNIRVRLWGYNGVETVLPDGTVSGRWEPTF